MANETEISAAPWALRLGKGLYLLTFFTYVMWWVGSRLSCRSVDQRSTANLFYDYVLHHMVMAVRTAALQII